MTLSNSAAFFEALDQYLSDGQKKAHWISLLTHFFIFIVMLFFAINTDKSQMRLPSTSVSLQLKAVQASPVQAKKKIKKGNNFKLKRSKVARKSVKKKTDLSAVSASPRKKAQKRQVMPGDRDHTILSGALAVLYPKSAQNEELEGEVAVQVFVNKKGKVKSVKLIRSSGHAILDQIFIKTVIEGALFLPKQEYGNPLDSSIILKHRFSL